MADDIDNGRERARGSLGWLRAWWSRLIAGVAFCVVAGVTGRISYVHIQALSLALHQPPGNARLMPFGVDGLIVVGSVALLQAPRSQEWLGWICVAPGSVVSLFANVESGLRWGLLSAAWAGVASMSFIAATYTLERWAKAQFSRDSQAGSGTPPERTSQASQGDPGDGSPAAPQPVTVLKALRLLLDAESERDLAFILKVDRNKVSAWKRQLDVADAAVDEPALEPSLNGSAPGA